MCNHKEIDPKIYYDGLIQLGLDTKIKYDQIEEYISKDAIDSIGIFNHFSELLDIGFHPDTDQLGDLYRNDCMSFKIHRIKCISKNNVNIELPEFDIDSNPENFEVIINEELHQVDITPYRNKMIGGLAESISLLNSINSKLDSQNSNFRYIIFKSSYPSPFKMKKGYKFILDYRISLLPSRLLKKLIKTNQLILPNELKLFINKGKGKEKYFWGQNLPCLTDLIDEDQILDRENFTSNLRGFGARIERIIKQSKIEYDNVCLEYYNNNSYTDLITKIDFKNIIENPKLTKYCKVIIVYNNIFFELSTSEDDLYGSQFNQKIFPFLNNYLYKTNQHKFITEIDDSDFATFEGVKSIVKHKSRKGGEYSDKFWSAPHLFLLENHGRYQYEEVIIDSSQIESFYMGYLKIDYEEVKKYCRQ